jgi:rare lipoprotein A
MNHRSLAVVCLLLGLLGCASTRPTPRALAGGPGSQTGLASFYAREHHGRRTASGERFDMDGLTAAHRSLPFGTRLRVTNLHNGRSVVVRVNDRGPFRKQRILDVSYAAARKLGMVQRGVARVRVEAL